MSDQETVLAAYPTAQLGLRSHRPAGQKGSHYREQRFVIEHRRPNGDYATLSKACKSEAAAWKSAAAALRRARA